MTGTPAAATILAAFFSAALAGCALVPGWGGRHDTDVDALQRSASPVFVTAAPSYRLLVDGAAADAPSRLLVLYTRVEARSGASVPFALANLRLRLGNGQFARIFDPERAAVLVRRTRLGAANLSYLHTSGERQVPGGLPPWGQEALRKQLLEHLLAGGTVRPDEPLRGYLVVDTLEPLASLDGAVLEAITEHDGVAARDTFLFTRTGAAPKEATGAP
jgi:hypothetical protein